MPEPSFTSRCPYLPESILLDPIGHVASLKNATTAGTMTSALSPIEVSFEIVDPPGLSRCVVNCPELKADDLTAPPRVNGADGAFLLISVAFPERRDRGMQADIFVYKAGPGTPSLHLLPHPYPINFYSHIGVICRGDGHCSVVIPERRFDDGGQMRYDLLFFSSETNSWTTKTARLASDLEGRYHLLRQHQPTKVFSVGGNSLAWVDVYIGVLLCDVLGMEPEMRLIDLPPLMATNKVHLGGGIVGPKGYLRAARDVICKDGWIRCIETEFPELTDINPEFRWTAIVSKRRMFSCDRWETVTVDSASLSPMDSCLPDLFPEIWDKKDMLTLNKVISTSPILDAYHENVVYMKSKLNPLDPNGWVLAIDIRDKKLVRVVPFSTRRLYFDHYYLQCDFSKYISNAPVFLDTSMAKAPEKRTNRENIVLLETNLLAALDQLNNIESHVASLKQGHCGSMSLLCSGEANNHKISEYHMDHGRGTYVSYPMDNGLRFIRSVDLHISSPLDAMKNKIRAAHGALFKLMQNLPPNVLDEEIHEYEGAEEL